MATPIEPRDLGAEHLDRIVDVGWQTTSPGGVIFRSSARGILIRVTQTAGNTSVTVTVGTHAIEVDATREKADILID